MRETDNIAPPLLTDLIERIGSEFRFKITLLITLMPAFTAGYVATQYLSPFEPTPVPATAADRAIPFATWWVWPYVSLYVFIPLGPGLSRHVDQLRNYAWALIWTALFCFAVFIVYPTSIPRAFVDSGEPMNWAMRLIVWVDRPVNAWPSLHASLVALTLIAGWRALRDAQAALKWGAALVGLSWAIMILLGTLGTKQHRFIDLVAGSVVAIVAYAIVHRRSRPLS